MESIDFYDIQSTESVIVPIKLRKYEWNSLYYMKSSAAVPKSSKASS